MAIGTITKSDKETATNIILENFDAGLLERILSEEDVYLGLQQELLSLRSKVRHQKLAEIVVKLLGDRLLQSQTIRNEFCKNHNVPSPSTWKPGTASSFELCKKIGLPIIFAGAQISLQPPVVTRVEHKPLIPELADYQEEVYNYTLNYIKHGKSALLSLPTGGGKTLVATKVVHSYHNKSQHSLTSLWLAHTEELCEQAAQCLIQVWQASANDTAPSVIIRAWGRNINKIINGEIFQDAEANQPETPIHTIIVSTPRSAIRLLNVPTESSLGKAIQRMSLVVIDEAHRAAAATYRSVISELRNVSTNKKFILGLSATPVRETYSARKYDGTKELASIFDKLIEPANTFGNIESPILALQHRGILAKMRVIKLQIGESSSKELARKISEIRLQNKTNSPALFFSSNISNAKIMAMHLADGGLDAEYVTSIVNASERANIIQNLRNCKIDVLCNCEILTTGFDAPRVEEIYLARYTNSPVLYKQIIGRGLRGPQFGGASECKIYLCGFDLPFDPNPNTSSFARLVWSMKDHAT